MEKLLALGAVSLFIGMATVTLSGSQDRGGNCVLDGEGRPELAYRFERFGK
jgi:hypothetical protein